jgi:hypothetical protein
MPIVTNSVDARWLRCIFIGATIFGSSLEAQPARRAPKEIAQIVDVALQAAIPPETILSMSSATVAERGVRIDYAKTMAAFGYDFDDSTARSSLQLRSVVTPGSDVLLSDCDQIGRKPCKLLGTEVYVVMDRVSVTDTSAVVWVHIRWVSTYEKQAFMSGFSKEVHLSRTASKTWKFDHISRAIM